MEKKKEEKKVKNKKEEKPAIHSIVLVLLVFQLELIH